MKTLLYGIFSGDAARTVDESITQTLPLFGGTVRMIFDTGGPSEIRVNQQPYALPPPGSDAQIPCSVDASGKMVIAVTLADGTVHTQRFLRSTDVAPDQELSHGMADFHGRLRLLLTSGELTAQTLLDAIKDGRLPILVMRNPLTGIDESALIAEIEKELPHFRNVCSRPRLHLHVEEQIRPVAAVRRTGPAALRHLASRSEHWEARTFQGLRPARLLAQVAEDDLELYENRFVITLLKRVNAYLGKMQDRLEEARRQRLNALDFERLVGDSFFTRRGEMVDLLFPSVRVSALEAEAERLSEVDQHLRRLRRDIEGCLSSRFAQILRRAKPVTAPINPTNILRMDPNYSPLFRLWKVMDQDKLAPQNALDGSLPHDLAACYAEYSQVVLLAALLLSGYTPVEGLGQTVLRLDHGTVRSQVTFGRGEWRIHIATPAVPFTAAKITLLFERVTSMDIALPTDLSSCSLPADVAPICAISNGRFVVNGTLDDDRWNLLERAQRPREGFKARQEELRIGQRWAEFINGVRRQVRPVERQEVSIFPCFTGFGKEASDISKNTAWVLDEVQKSSTSRNHRQAANLLLTPMSPYDAPPDAPPPLLRRLNTLGDTFVPDDSARWGTYRSGILPISPWQINSLLRFIKLINTYTVGLDIVNKRALPQCPACGEAEGITDSGADGYSCYLCGALWNRTQCPHCQHSSCYLRPSRRVTSELPDDIGYARWMEVQENAVGENALCGFCESPQAPYVPICPKCGQCARVSSHRATCLRCRAL